MHFKNIFCLNWNITFYGKLHQRFLNIRTYFLMEYYSYKKKENSVIHFHWKFEIMITVCQTSWYTSSFNVWSLFCILLMPEWTPLLKPVLFLFSLMVFFILCQKINKDCKPLWYSNATICLEDLKIPQI